MIDKLYYNLKPVIPRNWIIRVRRIIARRKLKKYSDIWPIDEKAGNPPDGWPGWAGGKKFALVLTHDVESAEGVKKVIELAKLEEELGFRSSFNFVAEDYEIPPEVFDYLRSRGFEIGLHGLNHNGNIFSSRRNFKNKVSKINEYLRKWGAVGFRAPSMYHNLNWVGELNIEYDSSTFDTDPFEPQPDGVGTIFPFLVPRNGKAVEGMRLEDISQTITQQYSNAATQQHSSPAARQHFFKVSRSYDYFVELPYTLPQDHTLFIILGERDIEIWKKKLDWIAEKGGMVLLGVHPDYMDFNNAEHSSFKYPAQLYEFFLKYVKEKYQNKYWNAKAYEVSRFIKESYIRGKEEKIKINLTKNLKRI